MNLVLELPSRAVRHDLWTFLATAALVASPCLLWQSLKMPLPLCGERDGVFSSLSLALQYEWVQITRRCLSAFCA